MICANLLEMPFARAFEALHYNPMTWWNTLADLSIRGLLGLNVLPRETIKLTFVTRLWLSPDLKPRG